MLRYSIAKLGRAAGRPAGTVATLSPITERISTEKEILKALRSMLSAMAAETRDGIIPAYRADIENRRAMERLTSDEANRSWFVRLRELTRTLEQLATDTVSRILTLESRRHTETFMDQAKRELGIDLSAVVSQEDLADYLEAAVSRNAGLIKSLSEDVIRRVEQTVYQNSVAGNSVTTLRKQLVEQFKITDSRARLIARDQTSKFNSDLNKRRQTQAGITEYSWMTARDERVRERHRRLEGKVYKWGEATGAEDGLPPGQPIQCRCVARAIVKF